MGEVLERAVTDSSAQALNERGLRPAVQPKIAIDSFEEGKTLEYSMAIELLPEIQPMDFSTLSLERVQLQVPDVEIASALDRLPARRPDSKLLAPLSPSPSAAALASDLQAPVHGHGRAPCRARVVK